MTRESILAELPPFQNKRILIKSRQNVSDIMRETLAAHEVFERDYDRIASRFLASSQEATVKKIFDFLKTNVRFEEEPVSRQQTKSPSAIIETGTCDCKCYALFIGGVLDALGRAGDPFDWCYVYASYSKQIRTPSHVFVEATIDGRSVWIDPVLSELNKRYPAPIHTIKKQKINDMPLYRLAGAPVDPDPVFSRLPRRHNHLAAIPVIGTETPISSSPLDWIKKNPVPTAIAVVALMLLLKKSK
jgi:hypothetical protein